MARDRAQSRQHQLDIKVKPTGQHFMAAIALTDSAMAIAASYAARVLGIDRRTTIMVEIVNAISAAVQRSIQFFHLPVSPTGRFNGGFNTGVRGGYEWGP